MKRFLNNNKGASLILVIGCVALLSVVGSMLLMVTANNREMKALEKQIQDTFYQAESGSDELLTALEAKAEVVFSDAFADMMIHYNAFASDDERGQRIGDYFGAKLQEALNSDTEIQTLMAEGLNSASVVSVEVGNAEMIAAANSATETKTVHLQDVVIRYTDGKGNEAKITTDIKVQSGIPNLEAGFGSTNVVGDYTDFALITNGNVTLETGMASSSSAKINGNMYTAGSLQIAANATLAISNAPKALIKNNITIEQGKLTVNNDVGVTSSGQGVWADGIEMHENGTLEAVSNFYIADDISIGAKETGVSNGNNVNVKITGLEYVGYNGNNYINAADGAKNKSSIVINNAKDFSLDMSGVNNLILSGNAYIQEEGWSGSPVMQGESLGIKNMQTIYLAPSAVLGYSNPVITSQFELAYEDNTYTGTQLYYYYIEGNTDTYIDLGVYLNDTTPFLRRDVILDGGASKYTYMYMNFESEAKAREYVAMILSIPQLRDSLVQRISGIGASEILLGVNNNTAGVVLEYTGGTVTYDCLTDPDSFARITSAMSANTMDDILFTTFKESGAPNPSWESVDTLATAVLDDDVIAKITNAMSTPASGNYHPYSGNTNISNSLNGLVVVNGNLTLSGSVTGIVLVNGNVTLTGTTGKVDGLLIATGEVKVDNAYTLQANASVVEMLLADDNIARFFRTGSVGGQAASFVSTEAVNVTFENWKRN